MVVSADGRITAHQYHWRFEVVERAHANRSDAVFALFVEDVFVIVNVVYQ